MFRSLSLIRWLCGSFSAANFAILLHVLGRNDLCGGFLYFLISISIATLMILLGGVYLAALLGSDGLSEVSEGRSVNIVNFCILLPGFIGTLLSVGLLVGVIWKWLFAILFIAVGVSTIISYIVIEKDQPKPEPEPEPEPD